VDFSRDVDNPEVTTFGDDDREYIVGLRGATISISGFWDATLDGVLGQVVGASTSLDFEYGPQGSTVGDVKYSGSCIMNSYAPSSPVDGPASWSADFVITGAVARGTY